mgnify:CR=1 FL=1
MWSECAGLKSINATVVEFVTTLPNIILLTESGLEPELDKIAFSFI